MRSKMIISIFGLLGGAFLLRPDSSEPVQLIRSLDGKTLYKSYCAACHGLDGTGSGPTASFLKVPPADLTLIALRNGGVFPMARIKRIISGEDQAAASHGPREMPLWGPIFSQVGPDQDLGRVRIDNLTRYLMSIQTQAAAMKY